MFVFSYHLCLSFLIPGIVIVTFFLSCSFLFSCSLFFLCFFFLVRILFFLLFVVRGAIGFAVVALIANFSVDLCRSTSYLDLPSGDSYWLN